jgi:hypothetical protein
LYFCIVLKNVIAKYYKWGLSVLFGIGVFMFWYLAYPHALSYQEQYQLFLWTADYFCGRICVPGGFSEWLGELVVQFYYVEWLGALLLALLFVALQRVVWRAMGDGHYLLSFVPSVLLLWLLGDPSVLLGYVWALLIAVGAYALNKGRGRKSLMADVLIVPLVYWLAGPLAWVYVLLRLLGGAWRLSWMIPFYLFSLQMVACYWLLPQWTAEMVFQPMQFYRIPLQLSKLMWVIPFVTILVVLFSRQKSPAWLVPVEGAMLAVLCWLGIGKGYDKDMYELIRQDYLVRNERWDEIVKRAQVYVVRTPFWSNCVNLALAQQRLLADRMFDFYQTGEDALILPRTRDLTSMLPSAEVFWRLGMVNSAQRYMFDTQESILNARKSGRCTKRIAECMMVNGHYQTARKQTALLKKSLFYRDWANEAEALMRDEAQMNSHPIYGKLRKLRYKEDFLYSYEEIDKMFGLLFMNNKENRMALDYFLAQMLLNGNIPGFEQYLGAAQQFGGYRDMPLGYQDVMRCIQARGNVADSPYADYAK